MWRDGCILWPIAARAGPLPTRRPLVALLGLLLVLVASVSAWAQSNDPAPLTEDPVDRRAEVRAHLAGPDAFVVTADEVDGELIRYESRMYYEVATQIDFADDEILWTIDLDVLPDGTLYPLQYDPDMFELLASPADVRAALPDVDLIRVTLKDKAIPDGLFLVGEQLLLGFVDRQLVYVESFALAPEGT